MCATAGTPGGSGDEHGSTAAPAGAHRLLAAPCCPYHSGGQSEREPLSRVLYADPHLRQHRRGASPTNTRRNRRSHPRDEWKGDTVAVTETHLTQERLEGGGCDPLLSFALLQVTPWLRSGKFRLTAMTFHWCSCAYQLLLPPLSPPDDVIAVAPRHCNCQRAWRACALSSRRPVPLQEI